MLFQPAAPTPAPSSGPASAPTSAADLFALVVAQGEKVRQLKAATAPRDQLDQAVQQLLSLKVRQQPVQLAGEGLACFPVQSFPSCRPSSRRRRVWTTNLAWLLPPALHQLLQGSPARVCTPVSPSRATWSGSSRRSRLLRYVLLPPRP